MPDVTPTGPVSVAVDALRTLLANVPYFQTWTGTADAAHALNRIFVGEVGFPVASVQIASGVLTITTREVHNVLVGAVVTLEGASIGAASGVSIDGGQTVAGVGTHTMTIATGLADIGPEYPDGAFILPCARPFAVISEDDDPMRSEVVGTGGAAVYSGAIEILFEAAVSTAYKNDPSNALYEMRNAFGQLLQGISELQGTADYFCLNSVETVSPPKFIAPVDQDDNTRRFERWQALVRVPWGVSG